MISVTQAKERILKVWKPDYFALHEFISADIEEVEKIITNGGNNCTLQLKEEFPGVDRRQRFCLDSLDSK